MKIRILGSAYIDLKRGRMFYENQAEHLGEYFFNSLFSDIDSLIIYAGIHSKQFGYFRMLAKRFPYAVYYKMDHNVITIWRILDCRQDPNKTTNQLNDEMIKENL